MEIQLDEALLEKLIDLFQGKSSSVEEVNSSPSRRLLSLVTFNGGRSVALRDFSLSEVKVQLSVYCLSSAVRRSRRSLRLIPLENARLSFSSLTDVDLWCPWSSLFSRVLRHYTDQSKRQALKILGATDLLGNPLGLIDDVSEGWNSFVRERNLAELMKNVAQGVANSTSKVSNALAKLGAEKERRTTKITEWTRGLLRPIVGALDFTSEATRQIKENSPTKRRRTRAPTNLFGLLEIYSPTKAEGHSLLEQLTGGESKERFLRLLPFVQCGDLQSMLSNERVLIFHSSPVSLLFSHSFSELLHVNAFRSSLPEDQSFLQLINADLFNYQCANWNEAELLVHEIEQALQIFREEKCLVPLSEEEEEEEIVRSFVRV